MNDVYGIYIITNKIDGKSYIGQTCKSFKKRWNEHIKKLSANTHINTKLQNAWNKYGKEAFEFKVLCICDELDDLNELEKYYIKKYDTYNSGYNLTLGGESPNNLPEEDRKEMLLKIRKRMRDKSEYSLKQIENIKVLLSKGLSLKEIYNKTSVSESTINNIKYLNSWVDIRSDLNDLIYEKNKKEIRNKQIIDDFYSGLTLAQLATKYNLHTTNLIYIFKENKIPHNKINKLNLKKQRESRDLEREEIIINIYNQLEVPTFSQIEKLSGLYRQVIIETLVKHGIDVQTIRNNGYKKSLKQSNIKGIRYNNDTNRWFAEIGWDKKVYYIGSSKDENTAIHYREKAESFKKNNDIIGLLNYISSLRNSNINNYDLLNITYSNDLDRYNATRPKNIRFHKNRFEVYYSHKYIGSSKLLDEAITIRENYINSLQLHKFAS